MGVEVSEVEIGAILTRASGYLRSVGVSVDGFAGRFLREPVAGGMQ